MKACDRHGIEDPVQATETIRFDQSQEQFDLCSECVEEIRKALHSKEIGFVEGLVRKVRGRPRKDSLTQEN